MQYCFTIYGTLPSLNQYIEKCRRNKYKGAKEKRDEQSMLEFLIIKQLPRTQILKPVHINFNFFEPNKRRDIDNISGYAHKVILDALVACRILQNDGQKCFIGYTDRFYVDVLNPRIEVTICEVDK